MIRKFPKLPHGYGCIRFLGTGRTKPYAVHLPEKNAKRPPALCYVSDWFIGFAVLTAWHAGVYYPGLEDEIYRSTRSDVNGNDLEALCRRIIRDYGRMNHKKHGCTVGEVYELYLDWKYGESAAKQLSSDSKAATEAAFELIKPYHSRLLDDVTIQEWQERVNKIGKQYSRSTVRNVVGLIKNLLMAAHHAESDRNAMLDGRFSRRHFVSHQPHDFGVGANENQVVGFASLDQFRAFGKEAVARMYGIRARVQGRVDDFLYVEVGVFQRAVAQGTSLVGHASV